MGTSPNYNIHYIISIFSEIAPKSMLDIGIGFGRYGFLAREFLDFNLMQDDKTAPWTMQIDGIEIYEKYLRPHHRCIYDNIYIGDAFDIIRDTDFRYDLMYAGDVLEHFEKNRAIEFIHNCLKKTDTLFINTPYVYFPQDEVNGNKNENHLSGWDFDDFKDLGARYAFKSGIQTLVIFTDKELNVPAISEQNDNYTEYQKYLFKCLIDKYVSTGQFDTCYRDCKKRLDIFENDFETNTILAYLSDKMNIRDEAEAFARKALSINPDSKLCEEILKKVAGR